MFKSTQISEPKLLSCSAYEHFFADFRMKGGILRFRGKGFSFLLIVLACTAILMCAWERTPFLATMLPPKDPLKLPSEIVIDNPTVSSLRSELEVDVSGDTRLAGSNTERSSYSLGTPLQREDTSPVVEETKAKEEQALKVENMSSETSKIVTQEEGENDQNVGGTNSAEKMQIPNLVATVTSANVNSVELGQDNMNSTIVMEENKECDYAKGKWVIDDRRPLYSGFGCKQWLAQMWACRLMQRKDFSYEKLRWQPKYCQMEEFEGSKFLERMRHKTLAFVGDSLGRQQFQSMMCMITGGKERQDVIDVGREFGLVKTQGGVRPNGWAYRFPSTNTTVLYYWSACLCDLEPINVTDPGTDYAMHLDRPAAFLRRYVHKINVLVLNTGHHWNRGKLKANRWVMYVGGMRNTNQKLAMIGDAKNLTIHSIVNWVNTQLPKYPHLKAVYRSISPRHFLNGDWNTGGSCDNTTPMSVGKELLQEGSSDYSAGNAVKGTRVKLLDITALSQLRDEGHISRYSLTATPGVHDCLHWCLPGVPDTWNEILFAQISAVPGVQNV